MIAYCGLDCRECGAYIATQADDDEKRQQVAREWSVMYKSDIKASDINCDGCRSTSQRLFRHCTVCEIRKCGQEKGVESCARCDDYICEKLEGFFHLAPECRDLLEGLRSSV